MADYGVIEYNYIPNIASRTEGGWRSGTIDTSVKNTAIGLTSSLRMNASSGAPEDTSTMDSSVQMYQNHKYYFRMYEYHTAAAVNNCSVDLYWGRIVDDTDLRFHASFGPASKWNMLSGEFTCTNQESGLYSMRIDYNHPTNITNPVWYCGFILVDLTDKYGAGNEPPTEYYDAMPYFNAWQGIIPNGMNINDRMLFYAVFAVIPVKLPKGVWRIECWGAKGGSGGGRQGGDGGYSVGTLTLQSDEQFYICCGGRGGDDGGTKGYNGGGKGSVNWFITTGQGGSGGGGTHIATISGTTAQVGDKSKLLLVAGGGGGGWHADLFDMKRDGGNGGGITGECPNADSGSAPTGGTQTEGGQPGSYLDSTGSGGSFGQGGDTSSDAGYGSGGGGGGLYGGGGGASNPGAGGSGYVSPRLSSASTSQGEAVTNPDDNKNGFVRITVVDVYADFNVKYNNSTLFKLSQTSLANPIAITYNNSTIAYCNGPKRLKCHKKKMRSDVVIGSKRLKCADKVMRDDIVIERA